MMDAAESVSLGAAMCKRGNRAAAPSWASLAVVSLVLAAGGLVAAQDRTDAAVAEPIGQPVVVDGVPINGPAPPESPAVVARDAQGRVTIRAVRITDRIRIDGELDEAVYAEVPPIGDFVQTEPNGGQPATEPTQAWIFFDDDTLYVAARCYDSQPESRWVANEMRRDSMNVVRNENFAIYFDTFYDRRNAFLFEISPIGGIYDATVTNERPPGNIEWNPVWDRKTGRFDGGWTAEMAIPFRSLRYKPGRSQIWGVNIRRTVRWKNEESFVTRMPPNTGSVIFQISLGATLVGLDAPPGSRNIEVKPYAISSLTTDRRAVPAITGDGTGDAGFDVKYGVTQNLTADFTYNTDFAQVEVDEQQVNLTRFSLFFPEKREFFLEGQGIFDFGGAGSNGARQRPAAVLQPAHRPRRQPRGPDRRGRAADRQGRTHHRRPARRAQRRRCPVGFARHELLGAAGEAGRHAAKQRRGAVHEPVGLVDGPGIEPGLRSRRRFRLLRQLDDQRLSGAGGRARRRQRRHELSHAGELQRRSVRSGARAPVGRRRLPSRCRLSAPQRLQEQCGVVAVQPAAAPLSEGPPVRVRRPTTISPMASAASNRGTRRRPSRSSSRTAIG